MAISTSETAPFGVVYERWEEVAVSTDKGKREVHYYLKRRDGGSDLVVIGKERSLRHMTYRYAIRNISLLPKDTLFKLKSRREVIHWLGSIVSDSNPCIQSFIGGGHLDQTNDHKSHFEDTQLCHLGGCYNKVFWLGTPWKCRKNRWHYPYFSRNGVKISVCDFVYVLAEENKRLVAYLEDMYEDSKGNRMVVVRWFHKVDEVGILLPQNFNGREIFFSLCLQDLSIECIDGLATVLSPQHFEKFLKASPRSVLDPFVCHQQFENDDVEPFDITQVKGYWKQAVHRYMDNISPRHCSDNTEDSLKAEGIDNDVMRPNKRHRLSKLADRHVIKKSMESTLLKAQHISSYHLKVGSCVEVLCQDSGMRGCWLRASVIKKRKDKVKVRYEDIQDAADEIYKLEEWILTSRVADPDILGIWTSGRSTIRPSLQSIERRGSLSFNVGSAVDVWWHDGWWEGIVIQKESDDKIHVYFPGEKQASVFSCENLRYSQEWLRNSWTALKERQDLVSSLLSDPEQKLSAAAADTYCNVKVGACENEQERKIEKDLKDYIPNSGKENAKDALQQVLDLLKDDSLCRLRWKPLRKRSPPAHNNKTCLHKLTRTFKSNSRVTVPDACERLLISSSFKLDHESCKQSTDSLLVPPLTSLAMSQ